ncbi:hypothetical protein GOBAR_DD16520 [Gossypium barbadense]|nr:hypothetical protein GOBAR_DD16520 [Gossypium barbadense]
MSSTEEGGGAVGVPGGAVSTDQTIATNTNPLDTIIPIPGTDFTLSNGELENLRSLDEAFNGNQLDPNAKPLIRRTPATLGRDEDFRKYFMPKVFPIGPLHNGDPTLHGSEKLKLRLVAHFVENIGVNNEILYNNIKTEIDGLKKCYDPKELEKYSNDDKDLAWMFFVDGCAILQAVYMRYGQDYNSTLKKRITNNEMLTFEYSDLFLLENQLPFRVLELLTSSSENGEKFMNAIKRFIDDAVITPADMKESQSHQQDSHQTRTKRYHSRTFPNVRELKKAGIRLKASKTSCLTDISFNSIFFFGKLWLPPITIDGSTMNLIVYEFSPDFYNNFTVTSYMGFLVSLIGEAENVKELRDAGILYNRLSDEEVVKLYNKMNTDLAPSPMIYSYVKQQIHNHRENMWTKYPAKVYHNCFRTRWTFFAFVGVIAALLLASLQTDYTINHPK